jgi:hypothetical protein
MMIWAPHAKTNGQWIANKIIQGFFGAPIESLCEISVSDVVSQVFLQILSSRTDLCSTSPTNVVHTLATMLFFSEEQTSLPQSWVVSSTTDKVGSGF